MDEETLANHADSQLNTSKIGQQLITVQAANTSNGNGNGNGGGGGGGGISIPGLPTPTIPGITSPSGGVNDPTGITSGLNGILGGLLGDLTNQLGSGIQDVEGQLMGNLTQALGVKDTYNLFLTKMCEGDYANENDPSTKTNIKSCFSYDDKGQGKNALTLMSMVIG